MPDTHHRLADMLTQLDRSRIGMIEHRRCEPVRKQVSLGHTGASGGLDRLSYQAPMDPHVGQPVRGRRLSG
jgi:hypothetical protein